MFFGSPKQVIAVAWRILFFTVLCISVHAHAQTGPSNLNVSGALFLPSGLPVTNASVNFRLEIWDKASTCMLYSEQHLNEDLSATKGGFSLAIGRGTSPVNYLESSSAFTSKLFENTGTVAGGWLNCPAGTNLVSGDERTVRVHYDLGGGFVAMSPDVPIASSAYAMIADTLQGRRPTDFVQLRDDMTYDLNQGNVENVFSSTNYARLQQLLNPSAAIGFGNQRLTNLADPSSAQDATTKAYTDTRLGGQTIDLVDVAPGAGGGKVLTWDSSANKWVASVPTIAGTAGGDLSGSYPNPVVANLAIGTSKLADNAVTSAKISSTGIAPNQLVITDNVAGATLKYAACANNEILKYVTGTGWQCASAASLSAVLSVNGKTGVVVLNGADLGLGTASMRDVGVAATNVPELDGGGKLSAGVIPNFGGDLSGAYASAFVSGLQGRAVASTAPNANEVLRWNNTLTRWEPSALVDNVGITALTGDISASGTGSVPATLTNGVVTTPKMFATPGANRLVATDGTTGATLVPFVCNLNESLQWTASGWACANPSTAFLGSNVIVDGGNARGANISIGTTDNFAVNFKTNNTTKLTILPNGNVGIGETNPSNPLTVNGTMVTNNSITAGGNIFMLTGGTAADPALSWNFSTGLFYPAANVMAVSTNDLERLRISAAGNVGIGTTSPNRLLSVNGAINVAPSALPGSPVAGDIAIDSAASNSLKYHNGTSWISLAVGGTGDFMANGSVPMTGQFRSIAGTAAAPGVTFAGDTDNGIFSPAADILAIGTSGSEKLRVLANGNIGVGMTTPNSLLDLQKDYNGTTSVGVKNADAAGASVRASYFASNDLGSASFGVFGSAYGTPSLINFAALRASSGLSGVNVSTIGSAPVVFGTTDLERMRISPGGFVGIGTSTPARILSVNGAMNVAPSALPGSPVAGDLAIDSGASNSLKYHNGTSWVSLAVGGTGDFLANGSVPMTGQLRSIAGTAAAPGMTFVGDSANGIFAPGPDTLAITTAGLERMRVSSTGRVGIGTTNPSSNFHIRSPDAPNGNGLFRVEDDSAGYLIITDGTGSTAQFTPLIEGHPMGPLRATTISSTASAVQDSGTEPLIVLNSELSGPAAVAVRPLLAVRNFGSTKFMIDASGKMGIGTTSPNRLLSVNGPVNIAPSVLPGSPVAGDLAIDASTANSLKYHNGTSWVSLAVGGTGDFMANGSVPMTGQFRAIAGSASAPGMTFAGDTDNGIFSPALDNIAIGTSGSEKLRVLANGYVGIGTTAPIQALQVNGSILASVTDGTNSVGVLNNSSSSSRFPSMYVSNYYGATGGMPTFALYNYGGDSVTTAPVSNNHRLGKLDFYGGTGVGNGSLNAASIEVYSRETFSASTGGSSMAFNTIAIGSSTPFPRIYIDGNGNVGVGTTGPSRLLNVAGPLRISPTALPGSPGAGDLAIDSAAGNSLKYHNGSNWVSLAVGGTGDFLADGSVAMTGQLRHLAGTAAAPGLTFAGDTDNGIFSPSADVLAIGTSGTEKLRVLANGNLGIGTTTPTSRLTISSSGFGGPLRLERNNDTTQDNTISFVPSGGYSMANPRWDMGAFANDPTFKLKLNNGTQSVPLTVDASGNMGIGTTAPAARFDINYASGTGDAFRISTSATNVTISQFGAFIVGNGLLANDGHIGAEALSNYDHTYITTGWGKSDLVPKNILMLPYAGGKVGIGTTSPSRSLSVNGSINIAPTALPGSPNAGDLAFDSGAGNALKYHNGSNWVSLTGGNGDFLANGSVPMTGQFRSIAGTQAAPGFSFVGDTDNGIFSPALDNLAIGTSGTEKLRIIANGNIGIGTSAPSSSLSFGGEVARTIGVERTLSADGKSLTLQAGNAATGSTDKNGGDITLAAGDATGNGGSNFSIKVAPNGTGSSSSANLAITRFLLTGTGLTTIGHSSYPGSNLDVVAPAGTAGTGLVGRYINGVNTVGTEARVAFGARNSVNTFSNYAQIAGGITTNTSTSEDGYLSLSAARTGTMTEGLRLTSAGYVGIGTTSPSRLLSVNGPINVAPTALPGSPTAGDLAFDSGAGNAFKYHNGSSWVSLSGGGSGDFMANGSVAMTGPLRHLAGTAAAPGMTFVGDTANGIFAPAANNLAITTSGVEKVRVLANGNVGIGTTTPTTLLNIGAGSPTTAVNGIQFGSDAVANLYRSAASTVKTDATLQASNVYALASESRFASGAYTDPVSGGVYDAKFGGNNNGIAVRGQSAFIGNVGVGTSSPTRLLNVAGAMKLNPVLNPGTPTAGDLFVDSAASNTLKYHNGSSWVAVTGGGTPVGADGQIQFNNSGSFGASANLFWDNSSAYLGVGTTLPTGELHVADPTGSTADFRMSNNTGSTVTDGFLTRIQGSDVSLTNFESGYVAIGTTGLERMRVLANGNVGIGTTTASQMLTVAGAGAFKIGGVGVAFQAGDATPSQMATLTMGSSSTNLFSWLQTYNSQNLVLNPVGNNVGIGTTSPNRLLEVAGPIRVSPAALPASPAAGDLVFDSGAGNTLKYHNGSSWVSVGSGGGDFMANGSLPMTGQFRSILGSAAAPGMSFVGDTNTGVYSPTADTVAISTNGVEKMRVMPNGDIGIGTTAPNNKLNVVGNNAITIVEIANNSSTVNQYPGLNIANYAGATAGNPQFNLYNFRGNSTTTAAVSSSDALGQIIFNGGYNTTSGYHAAATIVAVAAQNFTPTAGGTDLSFSTIGMGTTNQTEKMRLSANGNLGINEPAPSRLLQVGGAMRLNPGTNPASPTAGDIFVDSAASNVLKYHNGSAWVAVGSGGGSPAGSNTQIQYNNGGAFGASANLTYSSTNNTLGVGPAVGYTSTDNAMSLYRSGGAIYKIQIHNNATGSNSTDGFEVGTNGVNTYLNNREAGNFTIGTNNTERLRILSNGNVGIGTTNPSSTLDVVGQFGVSGNVYLGGSEAQFIEASGQAGTASYISLRNNTTPVLHIPTGTSTGAGNVGIGTTNPSNALNVVGGLASSQITLAELRSNFGSANTATAFALVNSSVAGGPAGSGQFVVTRQSDNSGDYQINLSNTLSAYSPVFKIRGATGNVGIGTTAPSRLLEIAGPIRITPDALPGSPNAGDLAFDSGASNSLKYFNGSAWVTAGGGSASLPAANGTASSPTINFANSTGTGFFRAGVSMLGVSTAGNEVMRIDAAGNVGIGVSSPAVKLQIEAPDDGVRARIRNLSSSVARYPGVEVMNYAGGTSGSPVFYASNLRGNATTSAPLNANDYLGSMEFWGGADTAHGVRQGATIVAAAESTFTTSSSPTSLSFSTTQPGNTFPTERLRIGAAGNVGIGVSATEKLEVNGNLRVNGQAYSMAQSSAAGSPLTFNSNLGNTMVWTTNLASPTVNIHNMKPGGSYLLVVSGTGTGTVAINCFSDAGTTSLPSGFIPVNGARTNGTLNKTMYNLVSDGTNCMVTWITGF